MYIIKSYAHGMCILAVVLVVCSLHCAAPEHRLCPVLPLGCLGASLATTRRKGPGVAWPARMGFATVGYVPFG